MQCDNGPKVGSLTPLKLPMRAVENGKTPWRPFRDSKHLRPIHQTDRSCCELNAIALFSFVLGVSMKRALSSAMSTKELVSLTHLIQRRIGLLRSTRSKIDQFGGWGAGVWNPGKVARALSRVLPLAWGALVG